MKNWARNISYNEKKVVYPNSIDEIQEIVKSNSKIRARGSSHTFNELCDTTGIAIMFTNINKNIIINEEKLTTTLDAGINFQDASKYLHEKGWSFKNLPSLPEISIVGAISTGSHGSGKYNNIFSQNVISFDLILHDGSIKNISAEDGEIFQAMKVNLGVFGVIIKVELLIEHSFKLAQVLYIDLSSEKFENNMIELMSCGYSVSYFTKLGDDSLGDLLVKYEKNTEVADEIYGCKKSLHPRYPCNISKSNSCTPQLGRFLPCGEILPHFIPESEYSISGNEIQSEYFVDTRYAYEAFNAIKSISYKLRDFLKLLEVRIVSADDIWLSGAYHQHSIAFHFSWTIDPLLEEIIKGVEHVLETFNYRPHWGKMFYSTSAYLKSVYPKFDDFQRLMKSIDPTGKFSNNMLERIFTT